MTVVLKAIRLVDPWVGLKVEKKAVKKDFAKVGNLGDLSAVSSVEPKAMMLAVQTEPTSAEKTAAMMVARWVGQMAVGTDSMTG